MRAKAFNFSTNERGDRWGVLLKAGETHELNIIAGISKEKAKSAAELINKFVDYEEEERNRLIKLVRDMRLAQKAYFKNRDKKALLHSKALEEKVDEIINYLTAVVWD